MFAAPALAPGQLVSASIRLERLLGQGGMGSIWVADHLRLRSKVVVKFVSHEHANNPEAIARFEQEAAAAAAAKSPHVVQIHDYGTTDQGIPFIAMELLEGEDLDKRLERGPIPAPVFAGWLTQACKGLARAHAQGIVHRDIKPENIFLCDMDGDEVFVKILDFGIAKAASSLSQFSGTRTGAFLGTAYYMSPEQTMGAKNVDHRTDLWSLAVVTYEALTGVRPFESDAIGALVAAITTLPIVPPSTHCPALSVAVDAWMEKALARDPSQRFGSAREMAESFFQAVHPLLDSSTVVHRHSFPSEAAFANVFPTPSLGTNSDLTRVAEQWSRTAAVPTDEPEPLSRRFGRVSLVLVLALGVVGGGGVATWVMSAGNSQLTPVPVFASGTPEKSIRVNAASTQSVTIAPTEPSVEPPRVVPVVEPQDSASVAASSEAPARPIPVSPKLGRSPRRAPAVPPHGAPMTKPTPHPHLDDDDMR